MSIKELRLDFEATLIQAVSGQGYAHYGYWPDGAPEVPTLQAMGKAQQAYFDLLAARIPDGTDTILDVGSGTGANALGLTERGFELECLCPSAHLNDLARQKLPGSVQVHDCKFEEYESERRFDLCLFAESFHYIELDKAFDQISRYAEKHVLIFDYFRRDPKAGEHGTRGTHAEFCQAVKAQDVFEITSDQDMTSTIAPTFAVLDHMRSELFGPFSARARRTLAQTYPLRMRLAELLFGRKLDRIERPAERTERFTDSFEYRLILMRRR